MYIVQGTRYYMYNVEKNRCPMYIVLNTRCDVYIVHFKESTGIEYNREVKNSGYGKY